MATLKAVQLGQYLHGSAFRQALHEPVKEQPKIRHRERSEAILAVKLRLPRRFAPRSGEVHGLSTAILWLKTRKDEVHGLCAVLLTKIDNSGRTVLLELVEIKPD